MTVNLYMGLVVNEKLLEYLNGDTTLYPASVATQFPDIIEKLVNLWENAEIDKYLDELIFDNRGNRRGFPPEVADDLWKLHHYRLKLASDSNPTVQSGYWVWINN
jgi:hypothetical protein